ncbi:EVI5-like protein isoform X2 [Stylophora pistillata]|uniref:EVI5-like protein isoform X2 n=1 Tax=Stylophora pistillata TaxID=50429 RepID=UPI000C048296|nr:EVI5-like protein isoform X2 [Stylophora pistillata]
MDNSSKGELEDGSVPETLKPPPRSKSRTKSVDELLAHLEEQNRLLSSDSKALTTIPDGASPSLGNKRWSACSTGSNSLDATCDSPETPDNHDELCGEADTYHQWGQLINHWSDSQRKKPKFIRDMVRRGVPNALRGMVWQLLCEARDSPLRDQYPQLIKSNSACERMIKRDIARTFPDHSFFKDKDGIGQGTLYNVIKAYSVWDKEVGYCQGSAFIVGILLMQMPEEDAFCVFVKLMQDYRMREIFKPTMAELGLCIFQLESMLQGFHTAMYASSWFLTLFASVFPLNASFRIMDVFICEGREGLFRVIMAMLTLGQDEILELDMEGMLKYFQKTMPDKYEEDMNVLMKAAAEAKVSTKKLKRLEKEYTRVKHKEAEDNEELRRLKTENRLLLQRIDELEKESASLADRLIQGQITRAQEQEEIYALKRDLVLLKKHDEATTAALLEANRRIEELSMFKSHIINEMSGRQDASPPSPRDVKIIALEAELEEYKKRESKTNQMLNEMSRRSRDLENELYLAKESAEKAAVPQVEEEVQKDEKII